MLVPEMWVNVEYPERRMELLNYLRELADPEYQRMAWVDRSIERDLFNGIDEVIHFFFDDTYLSTDIDGCIGDMLIDAQEVEVVKPVVDRLDKLVSELGTVESAQYLNHLSWPTLVRLANDALAVLLLKGVPEHLTQ